MIVPVLSSVVRPAVQGAVLFLAIAMHPLCQLFSILILNDNIGFGEGEAGAVRRIAAGSGRQKTPGGDGLGCRRRSGVLCFNVFLNNSG
jgi:hypothetical protein